MTKSLTPAPGPHSPEAIELARKVVAAWGALPGGRNYSPKVVESWMVTHMAPMIAELRVIATAPEDGR